MDTQIYILIDSVFWQIHVNKQLKIHHQHSQLALSEHQLVRIGIFFIKGARFAQSSCHGVYSIQLSKHMAVVTSQWRSWNRGIRAGTANRIILLPIVQGDMKTVSASERRHCICNMFSKIVIDFLWSEMIEDGSLISHRECYDHGETKLSFYKISLYVCWSQSSVSRLICSACGKYKVINGRRISYRCYWGSFLRTKGCIITKREGHNYTLIRLRRSGR